MHSPTTIRNHLSGKAAAGILLLLTALGLYLRLRNLGDLGFWGDEDITTLAVKGILEHGYPLFPTGMIYIRSGLFLYLLALSTEIFGVNEFALRLPAALFGTATIPLAYFFAARLFGKSVGLITAALISISLYEIEMGRYARMYAPFAFFYLLTVYAFYHYYVEGNGRWKVITAILACFTITLHQLGFTLALFYLFPLLSKSYTVSRRHLLLSFFTVTGFFFLWARVGRYFFHIHLDERQLSAGLEERSDGAASAVFDYLPGFAQGVLKQFYLPSFDLLEGLRESAYSAFIILTLGCIAVAVVCFIRFRKGEGTGYLLLLLIAVCSYLQQFNLVLLFFVAFLWIQYKGLSAFHLRSVQGLTIAIAAAFGLWLLYGLIMLEPNEWVSSGKSTHLHQSVKGLLDFPRFRIVWGFFVQRPFMSLVVVFGFLWAFHFAAQKNPQRNALFIIFSLFLPLFATGAFESRFLLFRYIFHLDALYFVFFALGLTHWHTVVDELLGRRSLVSRAIQNMPFRGGISALLLLLIASTDLNPLKIWLSTERTYGEPNALSKRLGFGHYTDFKTTGTYVKRRLKSDDIVMVLTPREQFNYIGKVDYWIRSSRHWPQTYLEAGQWRDKYIGSPLIMKLEELEQVIDERNDRRVWIIASSRLLGNTSAVSKCIVNFLNELDDQVVYVGEDGTTKVYLINGDSDV